MDRLQLHDKTHHVLTLLVWSCGIGLAEIDVNNLAHRWTAQLPPAATTEIAATKQKQNQQYDDQQRGVVHDAPLCHQPGHALS